MTLGIIIGLVIAAGVLLMVNGLVPTNPVLERAIDRLSPDTDPTTDTTAVTSTRLRDRLGLVAEHNLAGRRGFSTPMQDLAIIDKDSHWYWTQRVSSGLTGLTVPLALALVNKLMGDPFSPLLLLGASAGGGLYFFFIHVDVDLRTRARAARESFARVVGNYQVQMVMHRRAGKNSPAAMRDAATISDHEVFQRIRLALRQAQYNGTRFDDALDRLSERTAVPELREVGATMRLADQQGIGVSESLLARVRAGRKKILDAELKRAQNRTSLLNGPVIGIVVLIMLAAAGPALASILTAI